MTKEEFLALNIQPNDVVLVNNKYAGFCSLNEPPFGPCLFLSGIKTNLKGDYRMTLRSIKSIKVIGRVE